MRVNKKPQLLWANWVRLGYRVIGGLMGLVLVSQGMVAIAEDERIEQPAQPYQCEDSVVTKVGYYFEGMPNSGIYANFKSKLGVTKF